FLFPRERVVVFVDGCFWHGCPRCYRIPGSNSGYWSQKISRNRARDRRVTKELKSAGWKVLRIWEHALESDRRPIYRLRTILEASSRQIEPRTVQRVPS